MTMETRKVQKVGGGTITVSLPRPWADEQGVEAGQQLYLYSHVDGSLVVRRAEKDQSELARADIEVERAEPAIVERLVRAGYTTGYKRLVFHRDGGFTDAQRDRVSTVVHGLAGVEITEDSPESITVDGVLDTSEVSVRQSVAQLRYATLSMHETTMAVLAGDRSEVASVFDRQRDIRRGFQHVTRHYSRALHEFDELDDLGIDRPRLSTYYQTAQHLRSATEHLATIATHLEPGPLDADRAEVLSDLGESAGAVLETAVDAVTDEFATAAAHTAIDNQATVLDRVAEFESELDHSGTSHGIREGAILDAISDLAHCGGDIAELSIQRSLVDS